MIIGFDFSRLAADEVEAFLALLAKVGAGAAKLESPTLVPELGATEGEIKALYLGARILCARRSGAKIEFDLSTFTSREFHECEHLPELGILRDVLNAFWEASDTERELRGRFGLRSQARAFVRVTNPAPSNRKERLALEKLARHVERYFKQLVREYGELAPGIVVRIETGHEWPIE